MNTEMKSKGLFVRMSPGAKSKIDAAAEKIGMDVSEYTRLLILKTSEILLTTDLDAHSEKAGRERFLIIWRHLLNAYGAKQIKRALEELEEREEA